MTEEWHITKGCPNCVWLEHAEELVKYYGSKVVNKINKQFNKQLIKGKDEAIKAVKESVDDPMLQVRPFLLSGSHLKSFIVT